MESNLSLSWNHVLAIVQDNIAEKPFNTWFRPIEPLSFADNTLTIQVPTPYFYEWLEQHYVDLIISAVRRVFGEHTNLEYQIEVAENAQTTLASSNTTKPIVVAQPTQKVQADPFTQALFDDLDPQLNPNYTFENYYSGESNLLARTAGISIAEHPGKTSFNPMFVYGDSGVGKTHLLHAIGSRIKETMPQKRVLYLSAHLFQVQYTNAVRNNTVNDFISFYQSIDVLLIDDIHELAGKQQTQNTFFHIFNHLHQNGKQLVMTSDRPPISLEGMVPRLLTRFKWGLTAQLERPDLSLRKEILVNKIKQDGLSISEEVIDYIASRVKDNVRDLEGIIVSLMAHSIILNREITIEMVNRVLNANVEHTQKRQITIDTIQETVCNFFELDVRMLQAKSRKREIVQARQISMYLSKKYTQLSLSRIGDIIGKKDHATVVHACKTITEQCEFDKTMRANIEKIEAMLHDA